MKHTIFTLLFILTSSSALAQETQHGTMPFEAWREQFASQAEAWGISRQTVDAALAGVTPDDTVVRLDRKQPESTLTFTQYKENTLPRARIEKARRLYRENRALLERISKQYGVPAPIIVALWGMESSFGAHMGNFSVVRSLATLAYEGRRSELFTSELIEALHIIQDQGIAPADLTGSWAGAMGQCQFMPSSYRKFAVDGDGDGKRDIWNSRADVFASIAKYLHDSGWNPEERWGRAVVVPAEFDRSLENIEVFRPLSEWRSHGIVFAADGRALPDTDQQAALIFAGRTTPDEGVYLIYRNYNVLLSWNRSRYFGTAVGLLADAIAE